MRKFTSMMLMLLFAVTAWGQSSLRISNGLLDTYEGGQYKWTSEKMTAPEGEFNKLRITFLETSNNEQPAGFPCVAIAEFYLYDKDGTQVTLTADKFSSNATQSGEGKMEAICNGFSTKQDGEGDYDWYWHSQWSGTPSPYGHHYLEIDVTGIANLEEYSIGWITRRSQGSPKDVVISTGATTADATVSANSMMRPELSTEIPYVYTIKNFRSKKYLTYSESNAKPSQESQVSENSYWYFTEGADGKVRMHNLASGMVLGTNFEMSTEGEWFISPAVYHSGVVFSKTGNITENNCIDDQNDHTSIGSWKHVEGDSEGTTWIISRVNEAFPALSLQNMMISEIGEPVNAVEIDKWYILKNYNRGAYVSQENDSWKMRATSNVAKEDLATEKAGYLFKITKNGEYYNIMSGNCKYFKLGSNTASTSTTPVNFEIGLIGSSTDNFYIFDKDNSYTADGQDAGYNFVGWSTTIPTSPGGNDSYLLLPVTLSEYVSDDIKINWVETNAAMWGEAITENFPATVIADATSSDNKSWTIHKYETTVEREAANTIKATFKYSGGSCALNILGFDILDANGNIVAGDYHIGSTGTNHNNNVYTVNVPEAGTYTARCYVRASANDRLNATNGTITISFDEFDTTTLSHTVNFVADYATLHLGYKVAIPEGVEAYVVSGLQDWALLAPVTNVIPAATPVILKRTNTEKSEYTFAYTETAGTTPESNLLRGSIANQYVVADAYVLANGANGIGLYKAAKNQLNNTAFLNNANKVYMVASEGNQALSYSFNFDWAGTTGIEGVEAEGAQNGKIYDITGREVKAITAPGIYIVNGKKVVK